MSGQDNYMIFLKNSSELKFYIKYPSGEKTRSIAAGGFANYGGFSQSELVFYFHYYNSNSVTIYIGDPSTEGSSSLVESINHTSLQLDLSKAILFFERSFIGINSSN